MSISTPHTPTDLPDSVYPPAEDSYLLLDALETDLADLRTASIAVEVGSGSGVISVALASSLNCFVFSVDINPTACVTTKQTAGLNGARAIDCINTDVLGSLCLDNKVDILVCNPPYVATDDDPSSDDIGAAWAGGRNGRLVTDKVIELLPRVLSPNGTAYIIMEQCNNPPEVIDFARGKGLTAEKVIERRAGRELLSVLKVKR